ncbi:DUF2867 domain-containing protein [Nocardia altamirensis]|uniref:DUF2867 domain-containing protein n=1 Tax=Nocardia altamirensis TaxID=472158 RepID=UPI0008400274|nr:DUF2867 domain-containing protein [Nocardia altamirensis]
MRALPRGTDALFSQKIPNTEFTSRPWRIHEFIDDFVLEDVWELPISGGPDDLATLVRYSTSAENTTMSANVVTRELWNLRWRLGALLGWDSADQQVGKRVASLRDRLPEDLLAATGPDMQQAPFRTVYLTHDEWTAEFSASIGHIVMHQGWVQRADGSYYSQMTALVKTYGVFGKLYMASIRPIRSLVVYPLMFRTMQRQWPEIQRKWAKPQAQ